MSTLDELHGLRELRSPITPAMLAPLPPTINRIQICEPLAEIEYAQVAALLQHYPRVSLRIYDRHVVTRFSHLEFLRFFPRLRGISIELFELSNFDGLRHLSSDLQSLGIGQFRTKRFSLKLIQRFRRLTTLSLNGPAKDFEVIRSFTQLRVLHLTSFTLPDANPLLPLRQLRSLSLALGCLSDGSALPRIGRIARLAIRRVRDVRDVDWLSSMVELREVHLEDLPNVTRLPDVAKLTKLKTVVLENLQGLTDITALSRVRSIRKLDILNMRTLAPESIAAFSDHPVRNNIRLGLGSDERNLRATAAIHGPVPAAQDHRSTRGRRPSRA